MRTDNVASFIRTALWGPSLPFSTHPLLVISRLRETTQSFLSFTLREILFIFLLSFTLTLPRNKNLKNLPEKRKEDRDVASPFALSAVISLKSNCTRKNGSPLSGKRIARLENKRLNHAYKCTNVGKDIYLSDITLFFVDKNQHFSIVFQYFICLFMHIII